MLAGWARWARWTIVGVALAPLLVELPGTTATLRHAGGWLGWLGAGLLSSSLLLTLREPWMARWFGGMERMYRWHHALGIAACIALLAHPLLLALAVLPTSASRAWRLLSPLKWFPANALGWTALLALFAGLAATLLWRLPYRVWRRFHIVLSVAVLLGIGHAFAYRGVSVSLLFVVVPSIAALAWRWLRTDLGLGAHPYEVASVSEIAPGTSEIALRPLGAHLTITPGQFVMAAFFAGPGYQGCGEFHPYTICHSRPDGSLLLAIKALGDCTTRIQSVRPGVAVRVQGPYGSFLEAAPSVPSIWIAGGIGVTPFIARLRAGPIVVATKLIYACRSSESAAYADELHGFAARQPLFEVDILIVQEDLAALFARLDAIAELRERIVYISGPSAFVHALVDELDARGVPRSNLHFEEFSLLADADRFVVRQPRR